MPTKKNIMAEITAPTRPPVAPDDWRQAIGDPPLMPAQVQPHIKRNA